MLSRYLLKISRISHYSIARKYFFGIIIIIIVLYSLSLANRNPLAHHLIKGPWPTMVTRHHRMISHSICVSNNADVRTESGQHVHSTRCADFSICPNMSRDSPKIPPRNVLSYQPFPRSVPEGVYTYSMTHVSVVNLRILLNQPLLDNSTCICISSGLSSPAIAFLRNGGTGWRETCQQVI